jgi:tRNA U34 5-methylaminomethyl-2-thiouridine-forming methyltransferase MnmC
VTEFKGKLGNYKIIQTEDSTQTIYSEYFDEACHNLSGAYEETLHNYIRGCEIPESLNRNLSLSVLDVGFGVGVGLKALIDQLNLHPAHTKDLTYYSIELDEDLFLWSLQNTLPTLHFEKRFSNDLCFYEASYKNLVMKIFIGDGRLTLPLARKLNLMKTFDVIFQDAFSPKKNPALWSVEWFSFLALASGQNVLLSTYSSSISIRKSLVLAGWKITNERGFAMKRSMTRGRLTGETPLELIEQMNRSPSLEIRDK